MKGGGKPSSRNAPELGLDEASLKTQLYDRQCHASELFASVLEKRDGGVHILPSSQISCWGSFIDFMICLSHHWGSKACKALKDMYTTQSLHGILSQVPVLLADVALTLGLVWTLETRALHQSGSMG